MSGCEGKKQSIGFSTNIQEPTPETRGMIRRQLTPPRAMEARPPEVKAPNVRIRFRGGAMKKFAIAVFCCALFAIPRAIAQTTWDLSTDLGETSNQISLNERSNQTWYLMESATRVHDPAGYLFLTQYQTPCQSTVTGDTVTGLGCWHGTEARHAGSGLKTEAAFNFTDQTLDSQVDGYPGYLPHSLLLTPTWERYVIVAWHSPITGVVDLQGNFGWRNFFMAVEVNWSLDKGNTTLKSGMVWGAQPRGSLKLSGLAIKKGEVLYFIVDDFNPEDCFSAEPVDLRVSIRQVQ